MSFITFLQGRRVLDFGSASLAYAGRILVQLGAEVILVEPPGGCALRTAPPLVTTAAGQMIGTVFYAYAAGKRSVTLDPEQQGAAALDDLLRSADIVLLPQDPGPTGSLPDVAELRRSYPHLVLVAATPFGRTGPRRNWSGSDTTVWASSGMTYAMGDPDRPPVVAPVGLSYAVTSLNAAIGALLALRARSQSGAGQVVDISMQEAVLSVSMEAGPLLAVEGRTPERAPRARLPGVGLYTGDNGVTVDINAFLPTQWDALAAWIHEDLGLEEATMDVFKGPITVRMPYGDLIGAWISALVSKYSKQEFFLESQRRGIPCGAVNDAADLLEDAQLDAMGGWDEHPGAVAGFRMPRGPLTADGARGHGGSIPVPGQDNGEIFAPRDAR